MTWVKVCGLTTASDVGVAIQAGADAVGFVNVPASPRFVPLEQAVRLAEGVSVSTVLLTIDTRPEDLVEMLEHTSISGVQPYGAYREEAARAAVDAGYLVLFPTHPGPDVVLAGLPGIPLLDTPSKTKLGGTGQSFDWALAEAMQGEYVLAGGLGPDNVEAAIARVRPWGVDASSRLEKSPGQKDHSMVADFITKAKTT